ncbi:MAG: cytochrome c [Deltaproteobacteria bacterium]|nr:cytochrome c [Deltaproteobacteria bacterium]
MKYVLTAVLVLGLAVAGGSSAYAVGASFCKACHGPGKKGGDLKDCNTSKADMIKYSKDPKASNPKATMPPIKATDAELGAIIEELVPGKK